MFQLLEGTLTDHVLHVLPIHIFPRSQGQKNTSFNKLLKIIPIKDEGHSVFAWLNFHPGFSEIFLELSKKAPDTRELEIKPCRSRNISIVRDKKKERRFLINQENIPKVYEKSIKFLNSVVAITNLKLDLVVQGFA